MMQNLHPSSWLAISMYSLCLKSLRGNICDVEVIHDVLPQHFSGLNSLDILIHPPLESNSFQLLSVQPT